MTSKEMVDPTLSKLHHSDCFILWHKKFTVPKCLSIAWNASNIQQKWYFFIITKPGTYVNKCVKSANWTKFHCSSLKNGLRNDQNAKISNSAKLRISNDLRCWFSKAYKVLPQWMCITKKRSINETFFIYLVNGASLMNIARKRDK